LIKDDGYLDADYMMTHVKCIDTDKLHDKKIIKKMDKIRNQTTDQWLSEYFGCEIKTEVDQLSSNNFGVEF